VPASFRTDLWEGDITDEDENAGVFVCACVCLCVCMRVSVFTCMDTH